MVWQKTTFDVNSKYTKREREAIAQEIIDKILERTLKDNVDAFGKRFPKYSKEYTESTDFKAAGKSKGNINLRLSFDMLSSLGEYVNVDKPGKITIGYNKGSDQEGKVEGNRLGTYGQSSPIPGKARDFLGLPKRALDEILSNYPLRGKDSASTRLESVVAIETAVEESNTFLDNFSFEDLNGEL